ncbi:hypothetical protein FKQ51_19990 [Bacillus toyonensis]|uniref:hypothetical protein n=1 Tax=Bacillus toyonensis TaxID=155322 RepID=UPI0026FADBA0|nr:hypothetical protein [Bacillus toyonensis]MDO8159592.1 hypothetical protein [Bacillus toyonensis]
MSFKQVTVNADGFLCNNDDGDTHGLKIYGSLAAGAGTIDAHGNKNYRQNKYLWQRDEDNNLATRTGGYYPCDGDNSFTAYLAEGDFIDFGGQIAEHNPWPVSNDEMGHYITTLRYDDLQSGSTPYYVVFHESDEQVTANFTINTIVRDS